MFHDQVVYDDDYSGLALDTAEGERVTNLLGDKEVIFMRNHGPLVVGTDIGQTYYSLYYLEQACRLPRHAKRSPLIRQPSGPPPMESGAQQATATLS